MQAPAVLGEVDVRICSLYTNTSWRVSPKSPGEHFNPHAAVELYLPWVELISLLRDAEAGYTIN